MKRRTLLSTLVLALAFSVPVTPQEPTVKIMFACPLVQNQVGPRYWYPRIMDAMQTAGSFKIAYSPTDSARAKPWAVGAAIVTDAQLTAVNALSNPEVYAIPESQWSNTFSSLSGAVRAKINAFCDDIGVARPASNEVLRDMFHRLVSVIEARKSIEDIIFSAEQ
jgi:hypothetical protein